MAYIDCENCFHKEVCSYLKASHGHIVLCECWCPNTDVAEVKHGEWIWTENGEADYEQFWVCSVCKEKSYIKTKFCSDCGAKMDGGSDNGNTMDE